MTRAKAVDFEAVRVSPALVLLPPLVVQRQVQENSLLLFALLQVNALRLRWQPLTCQHPLQQWAHAPGC